MKSQTIRAIFTNLLFVLGVILLIFGFTRGALTLTRMFVFDKYPLASYEETRCEFEFSRPLPVPAVESQAQLSDEELAIRKESCEQSVEQQRKIVQVEDIVTSLTLLLSGLLLTLTFKKFILK